MSGPLRTSVCMPVYKGSHILKGAIDSVLRQGFDFHEIVVGDDNRPEDAEEIARTTEILASYKDRRIRHIRNKENLGYARNLQNIVANATGDILFLLAQDDFLSKDALQKTNDAFLIEDDIGVVTRPYYWFMDNMRSPVRAVFPLDARRDTVVAVNSGEAAFNKVFESVGQLSGLAYRREFLDVPFNDECFPAHIYPFAGIFRRHKCVFLKDFTVAVGIQDSQTRSVSSIYDLSPTASWLRMFDTVFADTEFKLQRRWGHRQLATNFVGLAQLKNYANPGILAREIRIMAKAWPRNLLNPLFWAFALGALLVPKAILARAVDAYKVRFNTRQEALKGIVFNY